MFQGTIPPALRSIVAEHARGWPQGADVYVGCSGNLTIERTLHSTVPERGFRLHSNDVNPYSCALGWHFAGRPVPFTLKDESREELGWLEESLDDGPGTLATLMLGTRFLSFVGKNGPYHRRMVAGYRSQWRAVHAKTVASLEASTLRLASFAAVDVREYLRDAPHDAPVASFPPFWGGGYETMFAGIEDHFDWPAPQYEILGEDGKAEIVDLIVDRPHWLLGLHYELPELERFRVGFVKATARAMPIWVFAHPGVPRYVGPVAKTAPILMPRLGREDHLGTDLTLHPLSSAQFNGLRAAYLARGIAPGEPLFSCAVASGGRVLGAFGYLAPKGYDPGNAYLMSDFAVGPTRYARLSKLVVMAAISAEAQLLMQRSISKRITQWCTTAFSFNPISAKYGRGVPGVVLYSRKKAEDGVHTWQLNYGGPIGQWTLAEALTRWSSRHGRVLSGTDHEVPA